MAAAIVGLVVPMETNPKRFNETISKIVVVDGCCSLIWNPKAQNVLPARRTDMVVVLCTSGKARLGVSSFLLVEPVVLEW